MTNPEVRPVWMSRVQRDLFVNPQVPGDREAVMRELIQAWDAAPADPITVALEAAEPAAWPLSGQMVFDVLRALGFPEREAS